MTLKEDTTEYCDALTAAYNEFKAACAIARDNAAFNAAFAISRNDADYAKDLATTKAGFVAAHASAGVAYNVAVRAAHSKYKATKDAP